MSEEFLGDRKQALEDAFFHKMEADKIAAKKAAMQRQQSVAELRKVSGIDDEPVLERLVELGVSAGTIAAVSLVPLIDVAWADGKVQPEERDAILQAAKGKGIEEGSHAYELLGDWLENEPKKQLFAAWAAYIESLTAAMNDSQVAMLQRQVVGLARDVARSAGGIMGINVVSAGEKDALDRIAHAFERR